MSRASVCTAALLGLAAGVVVGCWWARRDEDEDQERVELGAKPGAEALEGRFSAPSTGLALMPPGGEEVEESAEAWSWRGRCL